MTFGFRNLLQIADSSPRKRLLRAQCKRKKKTAAKNLKASVQRLKSEMQEISKDQQIIKEGQSQLRKKLEAIEAECAQLRKETDLVLRESALNKLKLCLMFNIVKAREEGDLTKATQLVQLLRAILTSHTQN